MRDFDSNSHSTPRIRHTVDAVSKFYTCLCRCDEGLLQLNHVGDATATAGLLNLHATSIVSVFWQLTEQNGQTFGPCRFKQIYHLV